MTSAMIHPQGLSDIGRLSGAILAWLRKHPDKVDTAI